MAISLKINGQQHTLDVPPEMPLLWAIRDVVGLHGTKYGCGIAACGACTVHVGGEAVRSCVTAVGDVGDAEVTTIEGLHPTGDHPVQRAWRELNVPQCGFCQTGQIMQAAAFLATTRNPTDQQVTEAMSGNICRCGCYQRIHAAVKAAGTGV
jgi:isoquinoline 1-oxidoreductase subunit alpha